MVRARWMPSFFALTTFLSAFLLFQIQPLLSKSILPWFGGSPAVWTVCMLFFQMVLFAGYVYAHVTTRYLPREIQASLHVLLLAAAVFLGPITPAASWKPQATDDPTSRILSLLTVCVGLPYFLLSTTGPLLQAWFSRISPGMSPYRLYALSNAGSLLALLSYPFAFEPAFEIARQGQLWSWGFVAFAVCCALCALANALSEAESTSEERAATETVADIVKPAGVDWLLWMGLAMTACVLLLATTNQVCQEVAVIPFLWVLPLTLYLLSFILTFDSTRWYSRTFFFGGLLLSTAASVWMMYQAAKAPLLGQLLAYFSMLFCGCMVCHGELVRLKPHPRFLTSFYLCISAGGAAGGLFVGILATHVFPGFYEWHLGIIAACVLPLFVFFRDPASLLFHGRTHWAWAGLIACVGSFGISLWMHARQASGDTIDATRNFFGVLKIEARTNSAGDTSVLMKHGGVLHGQQFTGLGKRKTATTYYAESSGIGVLLRTYRPDKPRKVGFVGLGAGTLAVYGRASDHFRFYEINPEVVRLANRYFTYLSDCSAQVDVVLGDARLQLEQESPQEYDVLVLDAFSGDGVPVHLLTSEAFDTYHKHLKPAGVIAVHVSNRHLDLRPVLLAQAERAHRRMQSVRFNGRNLTTGGEVSTWAFLTTDVTALAHGDFQKLQQLETTTKQLWTDARSDLLAIMSGPN